MRALVPPNEDSRVAAIRAYDILDMAEEDIFDAITRAAAQVCSTPMASLSLMDEARRWFERRVGLSAKESRRNHPSCANAIQGEKPFAVTDAAFNTRVAGSLHANGDPNFRFYAGMPLIAPGGNSSGALCLLDNAPLRLTAEQAQMLNLLADSARRVINLRRNLGLAVYAKAVDMTSDGVAIAAPSPSGLTIIYANESFLRFTGYEFQEAIGQRCTFPATEDCPAVSEALEEAISKGQMTTVECKFRKKDRVTVWDRISFVPYIDEQCKLVYVVAVHRDVSYQKEAEVQAQQLHAMRTTLATVDHVVKNFMNTAQLYSLQAASGKGIDPKTQQAFDAALQSTRMQLAAIHGMSVFRDRPTPFGISLLDHEHRQP